jgi:hypothetical protein
MACLRERIHMGSKRQVAMASMMLTLFAVRCHRAADSPAPPDSVALIRVLVVQDVMDEARKGDPPGSAVFCVGLGEQPGSQLVDPPRAMILSLRTAVETIYPASECDVTERGVRHRVSARDGVLIGVGQPSFRTSDVASAKSWYFRTNFDARMWSFTVNKGDGMWSIVNSTLEAIS